MRPQLWLGRGRDLLAPGGLHQRGRDAAPTLGDKNEVLYLVNRPGNVPSHKGTAEWIDRAVGLVAPHVERVCVRGDTDFSLTAHFDS